MRLLLVFFTLSCAGPVIVPCHDKGQPYTSERPTQRFTITVGQGMYNSWFADGAPTVLTIHNPTEKQQFVHVVCNPSVDIHYIDRGHIEGYFCIAPHSEIKRLVEFMNIDAINPVCYVANFEEQCI